MQYHNIDGGASTSCQTCCCLAATAKPGESDKWVINYAPVVLPANGIGLTEGSCFDISKQSSCEDCGGADLVHPELISTESNQTYLGNLQDAVDTPAGTPLSFSGVMFSGPKHGRLIIDESGSYTYTPHAGYVGYDRFFWSVSINGGKPVIAETVLGVGDVLPPALSQLTPDLKITCCRVDNRQFTLTFVLETSPAAVPGDTYRLTIKQGIKDCDCCWDSKDCFDITIGACG